MAFSELRILKGLQTRGYPLSMILERCDSKRVKGWGSANDVILKELETRCGGNTETEPGEEIPCNAEGTEYKKNRDNLEEGMAPSKLGASWWVGALSIK